MPTPDTVHEWAERLLLWSGTRDTLEHFDSQIFDEDLKRCKRVTLEEWERRPGKFKEWLAGLLKWQL